MIDDMREIEVVVAHSERVTLRANRGTALGPFHLVGIVYEIEGVGEELRFEQDGSTDRCQWFTREQTASLPLVPLAQFGVSLAWPTRFPSA